MIAYDAIPPYYRERTGTAVPHDRDAEDDREHAGPGEQPFAFHRLAHADRGDDLWKMRIAKPRCAPDRWTHA